MVTAVQQKKTKTPHGLPRANSRKQIIAVTARCSNDKYMQRVCRGS